MIYSTNLIFWNIYKIYENKKKNREQGSQQTFSLYTDNFEMVMRAVTLKLSSRLQCSSTS